MNQFIKSNKLWLSLLGLAVVIVFLGFLFRPKTFDFKVNADEAVKLMNDPQAMVSTNDLAWKQLIDIRPADLFVQGHPDNAINIPVRNLLDDESLELFDQLSEKNQAAVLYGSDELQATAPWLLLQQLGYKNLKLLKGGFTSTYELKASVTASTETSVMDISVIQAKPESAIDSGAKPQKKKTESVIPVRKESTSGGGC
jgi:rhodanese-related sulfurtransferase